MATTASVRRAFHVVGGGVVVGLLAFLVTSWLPPPIYLGALCVTRTIQDAGFDPWTGLGYGRLYECVRDDNGVARPPELVRGPAARTMVGTRHAIPLPIGVPAGCIAIWLALRWRIAGETAAR